jgi:hypothetical protein
MYLEYIRRVNEVLNERQYWEVFLNKYIYVTKYANNKTFLFKGYCIDIFDDKLILDDEKLVHIPLSFDNLSVTGVEADR